MGVLRVPEDAEELSVEGPDARRSGGVDTWWSDVRLLTL